MKKKTRKFLEEIEDAIDLGRAVRDWNKLDHERELPAAAAAFAISVIKKLSDIAATVKHFDEFSLRQERAVMRIREGLKRWLPEDFDPGQE